MGNGLRSSSWQIDRIDIADIESRAFALHGIGFQPLGFYSNAMVKFYTQWLRVNIKNTEMFKIIVYVYLFSIYLFVCLNIFMQSVNLNHV